MTINTPADLAKRMGIDDDALSLAGLTTKGGATQFLRDYICGVHGEMTVLGRHDGKIERAGECFERVTGEKLHGKAKRAHAS